VRVMTYFFGAKLAHLLVNQLLELLAIELD
jgi:hypothetical protein